MEAIEQFFYAIPIDHLNLRHSSYYLSPTLRNKVFIGNMRTRTFPKEKIYDHKLVRFRTDFLICFINGLIVRLFWCFMLFSLPPVMFN